MKSFLALALCSCGLIFAFAAEAPLNLARTEDEPTVLKEQLVSLEKQSWEAWKSHDGPFFDAFLSDDHVEVSFGGASEKAEIVKFVASGVCEVKSYTLDQFELRMLGKDTAVLTYHEAQDTSCEGRAVPSPCWVTSLFVRRDGRWLNALYQQTQARK